MENEPSVLPELLPFGFPPYHFQTTRKTSIFFTWRTFTSNKRSLPFFRPLRWLYRKSANLFWMLTISHLSKKSAIIFWGNLLFTGDHQIHRCGTWRRILGLFSNNHLSFDKTTINDTHIVCMSTRNETERWKYNRMKFPGRSHYTAFSVVEVKWRRDH